MVTVRIGTMEVPLADASQGWITQQVNRRRANGDSVCAQVSVAVGDVNLRLSTPQCGGGAGGRPLNSAERRIVELWSERGLSQPDYTGGHLVAFLQQLRRFI